MIVGGREGEGRQRRPISNPDVDFDLKPESVCCNNGILCMLMVLLYRSTVVSIQRRRRGSTLPIQPHDTIV